MRQRQLIFRGVCRLRNSLSCPTRATLFGSATPLALPADVLRGTRFLSSAPIAHPFILYLSQRLGHGPLAVRAPSAVASLLALLFILRTVRANVDWRAALFAAAILAVSASQIRYAQEAREYSLSVLVVALLVFLFVNWHSSPLRTKFPIGLCAALLVAPLVQHGLVIFAFSMLCTLGLTAVCDRDQRVRWPQVVVAALSWASGSLLSFFLTARYQFGGQQSQAYLSASYYDATTTGFARFIFDNSRSLLGFNSFPDDSSLPAF